ncbi:hypothetical protein CF326_g7119 [Tilletia indica]|nr:hypothetical protein CF326_g7119 [Tilletia indica]
MTMAASTTALMDSASRTLLILSSRHRLLSARTFSSSAASPSQQGSSSSSSQPTPTERFRRFTPNNNNQRTPPSQQPPTRTRTQQHPQEPQSHFDSLSAIGAPVYQRKSSSSSTTPPSGPIRDTDIRSRFIYLVDYTGAAGGGLTGPHRTDDILARLDRKNFWLQQVSAAPGSSNRSRSKPQQDQQEEEEEVAEKKKKDDLAKYPICKIVAKKEEFDQARAAAKRKAEAKSSTEKSDSSPTTTTSGGGSSTTASSHKDLSISWSSTPHDISYKLAKAKKDLIARAPNSRLTLRIVTKRGSGRNVGTPGTPQYDAELARKKEFLDRIHWALCSLSNEGDAGMAEGADVNAVGGSIPGGGVAKLSSEGVQWQGQGSVAVLVYEPVS